MNYVNEPRDYYSPNQMKNSTANFPSLLLVFTVHPVITMLWYLTLFNNFEYEEKIKWKLAIILLNST